MYCINCGKLISDQAKFCNYCGASVSSQPVSGGSALDDRVSESTNGTGLLEQTASEHIQEEPISTESTVPAENEISVQYSASQTKSVEHIDPPFESAFSAAEDNSSAFSESAPPYPTDFTPNTIPLSGTALSEPIKIDPLKEKPERKYTFGHIMMCLAAVAVMAIVAGVFAGLYFSVV